MPKNKRFNVRMTSKFTADGGGGDHHHHRSAGTTSHPIAISSSFEESPRIRSRSNGGSSKGLNNILTRPIEIPDLENEEGNPFLPRDTRQNGHHLGGGGAPSPPRSSSNHQTDYRHSGSPSHDIHTPQLWHYRSFLLLLISIAISLLIYDKLLSPLIINTQIQRDYLLAKRDSGGYFDDIASDDWTIMKQRVMERQNHYDMSDPDLWISSPHAWYQNNWEPDFTCQHERRVGGMGDGPKWVCDPHRIPRAAADRVKNGGQPCLVYSIGSAGNFEFELGLQREIGAATCEIHIFDIVESEGEIPDGMTFHQWGLETSQELTMGDNFKSFQEIVASLGHQGRTLDIFKVDCEGCEWKTFQDWFQSGVEINQILVETHFSPTTANAFFEAMQEQGFVTFHKEPNIIFGGGNCQEYAMIRLAPSFYES